MVLVAATQVEITMRDYLEGLEQLAVWRLKETWARWTVKSGRHRMPLRESLRRRFPRLLYMSAHAA